MSVLIRLSRWLLGVLAKVLFPLRREPLPMRPKRLLVIRTDERVGNVLLTIPLLRALRRGLPSTELTFLHAASKRALLEGLGYADHLVPFERRDFFRHPLSFARALLALRRAQFEVVIEAGHYHAFSLTAALLARFIRPRAVIGHDRGAAKELFEFPVAVPPSIVQDVEAKLTLLQPLGIAPAGLELETHLGADGHAAATIENALATLGLAGAQLLLVNPGARKLDRRWPPARYAQASARLATAFELIPIVLWGPGEEELARAVVARVPGAHLAPPTDLCALAALLRRSSLFLTNDTGPMHLGAAVGVPTVAVFLAGDAARWGHVLPHFAAVEVARETDSVEAELDAIELAARRVIHAQRARPLTGNASKR